MNKPKRRIVNCPSCKLFFGVDVTTDKLTSALAAISQLRGALEKIADPRKRDHKEPDAYTQLGCVMHIADEALIATSGFEEGK